MFGNDELSPTGSRLGIEAADYSAQVAERYVGHECTRIELVNEPDIAALSMEGRHLTERATTLQTRLHEMTPPEDAQGRRGRKAYYAAVGALLTLTGLAFAVIGLAPFRLGWMGIVYCVGIALITPFAVDEFLALWRNGPVFKVIVSVVFFAAITGGVLLSIVRGNLLAKKMSESNAPAVEIEDADVPPPPPMQPSFYEKTEIPLRLLMVLFGLAIEIGGGVAINRARAERSVDEATYRAVQQELAAVRARLGAVVFETTRLRNAPQLFANTFWRDFCRAMLTQAGRRAITKIFHFVLLVTLLHGRACAQSLNEVVAFDLSTSEGQQEGNEKTPFARNVEGVSKLIAGLPAGAHITIIGILADSVRNPAPLLSAHLTSDPGYFGDDLTAGRNRLIRAWRARMAKIEPDAHGTDILGALQLAGEVFHKSPTDKNVLVIFSDMRNYTAALDLEHPLKRDVDAVLNELEERGSVADLKGVEVQVSGANGGGRDLEKWEAVKRFWLTFFVRAGAHCRGYSMLPVKVSMRLEGSDRCVLARQTASAQTHFARGKRIARRTQREGY